MTPLHPDDVSRCVRRLPTDIRTLLSEYPETLFVAGGFIRSIIAGEDVNDIDLFGPDEDFLKAVATTLQARRGGPKNCRLHTTDNAITLITQGRATIQFITRWTYKGPDDVLASFDFTVCQAVLFRGKEKVAMKGTGTTQPWEGACSALFYTDLAGKRLRYTHPEREEEAGGSLMRALKYTKRGYSLQIRDLAGVMSRVIGRLNTNLLDVRDEEQVSRVTQGILQEVDPSFIVDGLEISDDHETPIDGLDPQVVTRPQGPGTDMLEFDDPNEVIERD